jgi:hypothetical protein
MPVRKINEYLSKDNAVALRLHVWYALAIHCVSRGCEFHHQLTMRSLKFEWDENDIEYVTIGHETQQKHYQGGLDDRIEQASDKRLYATGGMDVSHRIFVVFISLIIAHFFGSIFSIFRLCFSVKLS